MKYIFYIQIKRRTHIQKNKLSYVRHHPYGKSARDPQNYPKEEQAPRAHNIFLNATSKVNYILLSIKSQGSQRTCTQGSLTDFPKSQL